MPRLSVDITITHVVIKEKIYIVNVMKIQSQTLNRFSTKVSSEG